MNASDLVKVRFTLTMDSTYHGEAMMPRHQFEDWNKFKEHELAENLMDYVNWDDIEIMPDCVDEFEVVVSDE